MLKILKARPLRPGFTLIELLVVIAIIAILAALLFPVFSQAREKSRRSACSSNLHKLSTGILLYTQDYDQCYPFWRWTESSVDGAKTPNHLESLWFNAEYAYVRNPQVFACPDGRDRRTLRQSSVWSWASDTNFDASGVVDALKDHPVHYGINEALSTGETCATDGPCTDGGLDRPSESLLLADCLQGLTNSLGGRPIRADPNDPRHQYLITRVTFANGPPDCYDPAKQADCGAYQEGSLGMLGTKLSVFEQQTRHQAGSALTFVDGHSKWLPYSRITNDLFAGDGHP